MMRVSPENARILTSILIFVILCVCSGSTAGDLTICPPGPENLTVFTFYGEAEQDNFGMGLDSAGDFNGDGIVDIIVGSPYMDAGAENGGAAYVFLGGSGSARFLPLRSWAQHWSYRDCCSWAVGYRIRRCWPWASCG